MNPLLSARAVLVLALSFSAAARAADVAVCTDFGRVDIELFHDKAPIHATNFLHYVDQGHYPGTFFHNITSATVQGGGYDKDHQLKPVGPMIQNESDNGLENLRGTVGASRSANEPQSAAAEFYINLSDNRAFNAGQDPMKTRLGYTVFGTVTSGMDVLDRMSELPTRAVGRFMFGGVSDPLVFINSVTRIGNERLQRVSLENRPAAVEEEIDKALEADDMIAATDWYVQYRIACGPQKPDMLLTEAEAAFEAERPMNARIALEDYLRVASRDHPRYEEIEEQYRERFTKPGTSPRGIF